MRFISWVPADEELMRLSFRCVVRNGIRRFQIADPSNDPERLRRLARMAREEGVEEIVVGLTYSISPVHTHAYYAERAAALAGCEDLDRLYLKDPGGLLTPDAVRELAPHFLAAAGDRAVELHSHTTIGLAPLVYVEGAARRASGCCTRRSRRSRAGRRTRRPRRRSATSRRRASPTGSTSTRSRRCRSTSAGSGVEKGLPFGQPQEFDATYYHHQLAGGMVSTTRRMLDEQRRPELFDAVLDEVGRVRAEMGYPIIVTPVSQMVATQAVRNVIDGERWSNVSVETIRYFLGHYGEPPAPVDPEVADRVLSRPGIDELRTLEPLHLDRAPLRARDLRRGAAPPADDARGAGGRDARRPRRAESRVATLLREVAGREPVTELRVQTGDRVVEWRRAS